MICDHCKGKFPRVHATYYGMFCNDCLPGSDDRERKLYKELQDEQPLEMPELLDLAAFERFMLKFSLRYIDSMPKGSKERIKGTTPLLLQPRVMSLHLKDLVVEKMPLNYVSSMDADGREKMFYGGTYQFKRKVPSTVILKALKDAGLIEFGEKGERS